MAFLISITKVDTKEVKLIQDENFFKLAQSLSKIVPPSRPKDLASALMFLKFAAIFWKSSLLAQCESCKSIFSIS